MQNRDYKMMEGDYWILPHFLTLKQEFSLYLCYIVESEPPKTIVIIGIYLLLWRVQCAWLSLSKGEFHQESALITKIFITLSFFQAASSNNTTSYNFSRGGCNVEPDVMGHTSHHVTLVSHDGSGKDSEERLPTKG